MITLGISVIPQADTVRTDGIPVREVSEVVVEASPLDDMARRAGLVEVQRGRTAATIVRDGVTDGRITTTINGMKITAACVDHMDPTTSYVEPENVDRLAFDVSSSDLSFGSGAGGTMNFSLLQPHHARTMADVGFWYDPNGSAVRSRLDINTSVDASAIRVAWVRRRASDYTAGGGVDVAHSGYAHDNVVAAVTTDLDKDQRITIRFLGNLATDVGFPSMLMDTRRAQAGVIGVEWQGAIKGLPVHTRLYSSWVQHIMDDLSRSHEEIRNRPFMPNMTMPMSASTRTVGLYSSVEFSDETSILLLAVDATSLFARASMNMTTLDGESTASMTNVGDVLLSSAAFIPSYDVMLTDDVLWLTTARIDVMDRRLLDDSFASMLSAAAGSSHTQALRMAISADSRLRFTTSTTSSVSVGLSRAERFPTHLEAFGFWMYEPNSNIILVGNPSLQNEVSYACDMFLSLHVSTITMSARLLYGEIHFAIAPWKTLGIENTAAVRNYVNGPTLQRFVTDVQVNAKLNERISIGTTISYVRAWYGQTDNAALIPPRTSTVYTNVQFTAFTARCAVRYVEAQNHISTVLQPENRTASYVTFDVNLLWHPVDGIDILFDGRNLADRRYVDHLSIRDVVAPGRSLTLGLRWSPTL